MIEKCLEITPGCNPWRFTFLPFKNRLPKKGVRIISKMKNEYAEYISNCLKKPNYDFSESAFKVEIDVYKGSDRLGTGDLDNYAKALLDIITRARIIWEDDDRVNELHVIRKNTKSISKIKMKIAIIKK